MTKMISDFKICDDCGEKRHTDDAYALYEVRLGKIFTFYCSDCAQERLKNTVVVGKPNMKVESWYNVVIGK